MAVEKGYRQSPEHVMRRKRFASDHHRWVGPDVSEKGGRSRAQRMYPAIGPCQICGGEKAERHHIDGNTANNDAGNIAVLCRRCHMIEDGRLELFRADARRRIMETIEAAAIARRAQTHCKNGHELAGKNLYINPKGARVCKACRLVHKRAYLERKAKNNG